MSDQGPGSESRPDQSRPPVLDLRLLDDQNLRDEHITRSQAKINAFDAWSKAKLLVEKLQATAIKASEEAEDAAKELDRRLRARR